MTQIIFNKETCKYTDSTKLFTINEKHVKFDTSYRIWNPSTSVGKVFNFSHSTGPEFDPNTKFVYLSEDELYKLEVTNDPELTAERAKQYLKAKTRS